MESLEKIVLKFCAGAAVFCLCVLWIHRAYAQDLPSCTTEVWGSSCRSLGTSSLHDLCVGQSLILIDIGGCPAGQEQLRCYSVSSCSCPAGQSLNPVTKQCEAPPPDECAPPNVMRPLADGSSICTAQCPVNQDWNQDVGSCTDCPSGKVSLYGVCADEVPDESFCPFGTSFFNGGCVAQSNECDSGYQVVTDASTGAATCGTNQSSSSPPTSSSQNS